MFEHSILRPAERLVERCRKNIVVSRRGSDVAIEAGKLCSACHHFSESIRPLNAELAEKIEAWPDFDRIRDISDTHKHGVLRKPERQIDLTADLGYVFMNTPAGAPVPHMFGFRRTEINARSGRFPDDFDVLELVYHFAQHVGGLLGVDVQRPSFGARSILVSEPTMETAPETVSFEDLGIRFYRFVEGSSPVPDHPGPVKMTLINSAGIPMGQIFVAHPAASSP